MSQQSEDEERISTGRKTRRAQQQNGSHEEIRSCQEVDSVTAWECVFCGRMLHCAGSNTVVFCAEPKWVHSSACSKIPSRLLKISQGFNVGYNQPKFCFPPPTINGIMSSPSLTPRLPLLLRIGAWQAPKRSSSRSFVVICAVALCRLE